MIYRPTLERELATEWSRKGGIDGAVPWANQYRPRHCLRPLLSSRFQIGAVLPRQSWSVVHPDRDKVCQCSCGSLYAVVNNDVNFAGAMYPKDGLHLNIAGTARPRDEGDTTRICDLIFARSSEPRFH